ncbi:MAG: transposase [bacterium]
MKIRVVEVPRRQIEEALAKARPALPAEVFGTIETVAHAYLTVVEVLQRKSASIRRLRRLLFGPTSEKTEKVLAKPGSPGEGQTQGEGSGSGGSKAKSPRVPPPGHGRNGHDAYWGAKKECVPHHTLKPGDRCPACGKGRVYEQKRPKVLVRVTGQPPLAARVFLLMVLRCNLCAKTFTARAPKGLGSDKYDERAASMIGLLKYGRGFPFNRLAKVQSSVGVPVSPSTQWGIVRDAAPCLEPAYTELKRQAAQGKVLHNDDTTMRILAWMGKRREASLRESAQRAANGREGEAQDPDRTGIFTSGIVSRVRGRQIALFFTGLRHAGENLKDLLDRRGRNLARPIQMSDALSRNSPKGIETIPANCITHGRRNFIDQAENFPSECQYIFGVFTKVYKNDAIAKKRKMTDAERLRFHQKRSGPVMEKFRAWMLAQFAEKKIEPNSGMGQAISYMLKHWKKLTLFLRKAGAPLDNNVVERALKMAILHRKNSMFYRSDRGAHVGDVYMSLIHTCDLNGVDAFDYLTQLQRHAKEVRAHPDRWMPWNYRQSIARPPPS